MKLKEILKLDKKLCNWHILEPLLRKLNPSEEDFNHIKYLVNDDFYVNRFVDIYESCLYSDTMMKLLETIWNDSRRSN